MRIFRYLAELRHAKKPSSTLQLHDDERDSKEHRDRAMAMLAIAEYLRK